jgi:hypothetical protein
MPLHRAAKGERVIGRVAASAGDVKGKRPKQTWTVAARPLTHPQTLPEADYPAMQGGIAAIPQEPGVENST